MSEELKSSQEVVPTQTAWDNMEDKTEQEKQFIDIDDISFATNEGQANYLWSVMKNEYVDSYKDGDENYDKVYVAPESQRAKYGMAVMDEIKNVFNLPENQGKTVRDLLKMKQKSIEDMQERRELDRSAPVDVIFDSSAVAGLETVKQLIDLLDIESRNRPDEIEEFADEKGKTIVAENSDVAEQTFGRIDGPESGVEEKIPSPEERTLNGLKAKVDLWIMSSKGEKDPVNKETYNYEAEEAIKVLNEMEAAIGQQDKDGTPLSPEAVLRDTLSEAEKRYAVIEAKYASTENPIMRKNLIRQKQLAFKQAKRIRMVLDDLTDFKLNEERYIERDKARKL